MGSTVTDEATNRCADGTYAKIGMDGYCTIKFYGSLAEAKSAARDWNGVYEDYHHFAEPTRMGAHWAIAVYDGCQLGKFSSQWIIAYLG